MPGQTIPSFCSPSISSASLARHNRLALPESSRITSHLAKPVAALCCSNTANQTALIHREQPTANSQQPAINQLSLARFCRHSHPENRTARLALLRPPP